MNTHRDFINDFLNPAVAGLKPNDQRRVAVALDAAIAFGALECHDGNASLLDKGAVAAKYENNVALLQKLHVRARMSFWRRWF